MKSEKVKLRKGKNQKVAFCTIQLLKNLIVESYPIFIESSVRDNIASIRFLVSQWYRFTILVGRRAQYVSSIRSEKLVTHRKVQ